MTLKVGIVGAGGISRSHAPHWVAVGAEVSVYSEEGDGRLADEYGLAVHPSLDSLLDAVDVVDVCTPTSSHADVSLAAIAAGRCVLSEKPLGRTTEQAVAVATAARRAGVQAYPAHVVRFFPEYAAVKAAIAAGRIGDPAVLRFSRGGEGATSDWFFEDELSGGIVLDQMIHDIDQARWMAGEVVRVSARQNPRTEHGRVPRIVVAHVVLEHISGAISFVHGTWGPRGMRFRTAFDIAGSRGTLRWSSTDPGTVDQNLGDPPMASSYLPEPSPEESPYLTQVREFATAFDGGPTPRVTIEDGVLAVAIAEAARASIRSGEPVDVDERAVLSGIGAGR
jgi:myo-inositol 2-dehydrogenase/D-chiro-inositol 1-dehydrogenase